MYIFDCYFQLQYICKIQEIYEICMFHQSKYFKDFDISFFIKKSLTKSFQNKVLMPRVSNYVTGYQWIFTQLWILVHWIVHDDCKIDMACFFSTLLKSRNTNISSEQHIQFCPDNYAFKSNMDLYIPFGFVPCIP